jgi:hypothetical protein
VSTELPVSLVDGVDGELHVGGRVRRAIVPFDAGTKFPGDIHSAVAPDTHAAVRDGGHLGGKQRNDVHVLVVRHQPFNHA